MVELGSASFDQYVFEPGDIVALGPCVDRPYWLFHVIGCRCSLRDLRGHHTLMVADHCARVVIASTRRPRAG